MRLPRPLYVSFVLGAALAAQNSSILPRSDVQLTQAQGLIQDVAAPGIVDVGFNQIDIASPHDFAAAGATGVATPQLVIVLYPDLDAARQVVFRVRRSIDGGRSWLPPVTVYTADTAGGEDLNTGDEGTHLFARGSEVYVSFHSNAHNKAQQGQSLWVVASADQGVSWSPALNVSTGWNRAVGNRDWDVDLTQGAVSRLGLALCWEADFDNPLSPGNGNPAPNNNENLYLARVAFQGTPPVLTTIVPETALTTFAMGTADVDDPTIAMQDATVLIAWVDDAHLGLAPGGNCTLSSYSFDSGFTWSPPYVHSGQTPGTFPQAWAQPRKPWALLDGPFAFVIQEDSRFDEDDVWMDRGDLDFVNGAVNWTVSGTRCNYTSTTPGSGDVDGIIATANNGVLAILYRDDSAGTPLDNSNEAYLVVDRAYGNEFLAGTFQRHQVTTSTATIYDLEVVGNMIAGVYEGCSTTDEEGGIVLSHDRGASIESLVFTSLGGCHANSIDIDDLQVALSQNGDFNVVYADERLGGPAGTNANNVAFVTGGKWPRLRYDAPGLRLTMDKVDPARSGTATGFLMLALATAPGTDLNAFFGIPGAGRGHFVGLAADPLFSLFWANVGMFWSGIQAAGTASWGGIPNATALLGMPIHIAGGTLDFSRLATDVFVDYTDAILQ